VEVFPVPPVSNTVEDIVYEQLIEVVVTFGTICEFSDVVSSKTPCTYRFCDG
jgi:hypothetical protein